MAETKITKLGSVRSGFFEFMKYENLYSPYNGSIINNIKIDVKKLK